MTGKGAGTQSPEDTTEGRAMARAALTNDDLATIANRASGLAMDLMLFGTKIRKGEVEQVVLPASTIRALANLALAASTFQVSLIDVLQEQQTTKTN